MERHRTTLSFLTESKTSAAEFSSMRRVAMTLLAMFLLTATGAWAQESSDVMTTVESEDTEESFSLNYTIINENPRQVKVSGYEGDEPQTLNIPATAIINGNSYSVTSIGNNALKDCVSLKSVTIPNSVTSIGNSAFSYCSGLISVVIGNGVKELPNEVFATSKSLMSLTIGSAVLSIHSSAFSSRPIKTIWMTNTPPEGYTYAGGTVNYVANDLYSNINNKTISPFLSSIFEVDGVRYVPVSPSERTCDAIDCTYDESVVKINIGKTVSFNGVEMAVKGVKHYTCYQNTYINGANLSFEGDLGDNAFQNCTAMTVATLGNKITSIGQYAFSNCSALEKIEIPNAVKTLGDYAFYGCSSMASAKIGTSVITIGSGAFYGCSALPQIVIPQSVTTINDYVFKGCSSLTNVNMEERKSDKTVLTLGSNDHNPLFADCPLDEVYIGRNISYSTESDKGYSPFYRNTSLKTVTITNKETEISPNEFYGCSSLKDVTIGNGVTTIGDWAFSGCSSLDYFACGSKVENIGKEAFSDCTAMTKFISRATTPPVCGTQALDDINKWNCKLQVPEASIPAYQAADQWKNFFFIEPADIDEIPGDANGDGEVNVSDIVEIVNYIMNKPSDKFVFAAADMNDDGEVNVTDIVNVVSIIMSSSNNAPKRAAVAEMADNDQLEMTSNDNHTLSLNLQNEGSYVASQFDIVLSAGQTLESILLNSKRMENHQLTYTKTDDNRYKVVIYSLNNAAYKGQSGELLNIKVAGSGDVSVEDILFVTAGQMEKRFPPLHRGTTGISVITNEAETMDIYTIDGRLIRKQAKSTDGLEKGLYIINGKKQIVR